ncbi:FAD-binding oxidoreductase [Kallotenue papyrolyticum]|uniref:FAD-binding oxidoreductase n=1 Tax=Kallotenue papyrolyticum TaxID=1325125 RepID=UPI000492B003|nr:FAD-linked oxidase C-terminal domain-containing protein [Kallotenue papyrolyticum]
MLLALAAVRAALAAHLPPDRLRTADLEPWSSDATLQPGRPDLVVEPCSTDEVATVVRIAAAHSLPIITRGSGTGVAGGAVPARGGLVLSLARMNRILEIDAPAMTATVEAGVRTGDLQAAVEARGLFYPPDPASLAECTIGGNVATNAGGPRALKYGVTRHYVLGMTVVLADGRVLRLGGQTHKQAVGYDLKQLFIGSEGTLGIVTEVILRLIPRPGYRATLTALFPSLAAASAAVDAVLHSGSLPCALELMDRTTLRMVRAYLGAEVPVEAGALVIIEQDGNAPAALAAELERAANLCAAQGGFAIEIASDDESRARLWRMRRSVHYALEAAAPSFRVEDTVVPRSRISEMVARVEAIAATTGLPIAVCGHFGDGNLHPLIAFDVRDADQAARAAEAERQIVAAALELGGTLSGEHGIGLLKRPFLATAVGAEVLTLMRQLKRLLDPQDLLNPGKLLPDADAPGLL